MNKKIYIKKSTIQDSSFFYKIRNNTENRKLSLNSKKITINEHNSWFGKNYKKNYFYTCYYSSEKAGYIRGEITSDTVIISIAFLKKFQKKKIATTCFRYFEKKLRNNSTLIAKVKKKNLRSLNFFYRNNFNFLNNKKNYKILYKIYKHNEL